MDEGRARRLSCRRSLHLISCISFNVDFLLKDDVTRKGIREGRGDSAETALSLRREDGIKPFLLHVAQIAVETLVSADLLLLRR